MKWKHASHITFGSLHDRVLHDCMWLGTSIVNEQSHLTQVEMGWDVDKLGWRSQLYESKFNDGSEIAKRIELVI